MDVHKYLIRIFFIILFEVILILSQDLVSDLYDFVGNVWEWTRSLYYERMIPRELQDKLYILKGGSYLDTRDGSANRIARTGQRMGLAPDYTAHNVGFRCIKDAPHYFKKQIDPIPKITKQRKTIRKPKLHKLSETAKASQATIQGHRLKYEL
ncbi:hypothetical protein KUTeg_005329 [Tegillarca granosa]|uniref:Sulfatase-modifying factor enzyme-like domain-containing protein n=1 Tax=Tegillarca granosa TaxID=220873 RepID=A0ABQ9FMC4_TEGGR|nr:hypothetical protein KUTeg_005329 [Tegillarca granosa]